MKPHALLPRGRWFSAALPASLTLCLLVNVAGAQLPVTELHAVFPLGAKQGSEVEVTLSGANHEDLQKLQFSHPGISAAPVMGAADEFTGKASPTPGKFKVSVKGDVPPGVYEVRAVGRLGASNPRAFVIGDGEELLEDEGQSGKPDTAQPLPLGTTVNGTVAANGRDHYQLELKANQRVLIHCLAECLDSQLDGALSLLGPDGSELARQVGYDGKDPLIDFTAPADGNYTVVVHDFLYQGGANFFYRLRASQAPHIDFVFPPAGVAGQEGTFTLYGRNLPGGKPVPEMTFAGVALESLEVKVALPAKPRLPGGVRVDPHSVGLWGMAYRHQGSNSVPIGISRTDSVVVEQEPNNAAEQATMLTVPCEVGGQFYPARDEDWYAFQAAKGDVFSIEVLGHRMGRDIDPTLLVQRVDRPEGGEEKVSEVAFVDDPGDRAGRIGTDFDTSTDDPSYRLQVNTDGLYRIRVADNFGDARNDPRMVYRLVIRKERPDFRLHVQPREIKVANNNQVLMGAPVIRKGGTEIVELRAEMLDGFSGDIEVSVTGLPEKVTCAPIFLNPNNPAGALIFQAAADAPTWQGEVTVVGKSMVDDTELVHEGVASTVLWGTANRTQVAPQFRAMRDLVISVCEDPAPALVTSENKIWETSLGGSIDVPLKVHRGEGFAEELKLVATNVPKELKPADLTIKKDAAEGKLAFAVTNAQAKPGVYSLYLRADTKTKYSNNAAAIPQAEAKQKQLTEIVAKVAEELKQATADRDAKVKAAQEAATALKQAQDAKAAADKKDGAEAEQKQAAEAVAAAEAKVKEAEEAKQAAETKAKELDEKKKRADAAKKAADTELANAKKNYAAKDVNIALVSTPITVRVVASPLKLSAQDAAALKQGGQVEVPVKVERMYGFDDKLEIALEVPQGVAGITAAKLAVEKGANEGKLEIKAAANATPGEHPVTLKATATFNKVKVEATADLKLALEKVEEPAKK